jgi:hypothetical protein
LPQTSGKAKCKIIFMGFLDTVLKSFLGDKNAKDLKEIKKVVDKIKK